MLECIDVFTLLRLTQLWGSLPRSKRIFCVASQNVLGIGRYWCQVWVDTGESCCAVTTDTSYFCLDIELTWGFVSVLESMCLSGMFQVRRPKKDYEIRVTITEQAEMMKISMTGVPRHVTPEGEARHVVY